MERAQPVNVHNGEVIEMARIPRLGIEEFRKLVIESVRRGARIVSFFGVDRHEGRLRLCLVLAEDREGILSLLSTEVGASYPSLTKECAQAHLFEREIAEQWGVVPEGHPWLKPVRFEDCNECGEKAFLENKFFKVDGEDIHEVAVGPVHAGVIEPGHFRFQCYGEKVYHLEVSLGYQHRGVEKTLRGGPDKRTLHTMETLAGDTTIGHALAYCQALEALAERQVSARAQVLRGVALELERLANHAGDLGALAGDVGYLPTASYCGRIRGDFLNMTALFCGNRFGRGWIIPGGIGFDADEVRIKELLSRLKSAESDVQGAAGLLWKNSSVLGRFEETGKISSKECEALGIVGVAARACGIERDVRSDLPSGIYRFASIPVSAWPTGDVFARAYVRFLEIQRSIDFIREQVQALPEGATEAPAGNLRPNSIIVSLIEGWRGEICHTVITDENGKFLRYKVTDPSFHNWKALSMALREGEISDFPLCNKSFNLSYCGHDL